MVVLASFEKKIKITWFLTVSRKRTGFCVAYRIGNLQTYWSSGFACPLPLDQEMHMALTSPNESHDRLKLELW